MTSPKNPILKRFIKCFNKNLIRISTNCHKGNIFQVSGRIFTFFPLWLLQKSHIKNIIRISTNCHKGNIFQASGRIWTFFPLWLLQKSHIKNLIRISTNCHKENIFQTSGRIFSLYDFSKESHIKMFHKMFQ